MRMEIRQAYSASVSIAPSISLSASIDTTYCSKLSSCPFVSPLFTAAGVHTLPSASKLHWLVLSTSFSSSESQKAPARKTQPCPAVAAPDAHSDQTPCLHHRNPRLHQRNPRLEHRNAELDQRAARGAVQTRDVPAKDESVFPVDSIRERYEWDRQAVWWPKVATSREEESQGQVGGWEVGVEKRGRLRKLLVEERVIGGEEKGRLAGEDADTEGEGVKGFSRGCGLDLESRGSRLGLERDLEGVLEGGPFRKLRTKPGGGGRGPTQQSSEVPEWKSEASSQESAKNDAPLLMPGKLIIGGRQGEGWGESEGVPNGSERGVGNSGEQAVVVLGVEEDIAAALDCDLAALISPPELGTDGEGLERGASAATRFEALGGNNLLAPSGPAKKSLSERVNRSQAKTSRLVAALRSAEGPAAMREKTAQTSWRPSETPGVETEEEGLFQGTGTSPEDPETVSETVFDPLLDLLKDASSEERFGAVPANQRSYKTQHSLRVRQQGALSAAVEDETWLQRPWEVEQSQPGTGPAIGLERLADNHVTSTRVRDQSFRPGHDKKGKPWERSKMRQFYIRRYANRYGDKETVDIELPRIDQGLEESREKPLLEKPLAEQNSFLFPPLPRPLPHEIVTRRRVEKVPGAKFRSVPPKQRAILPMREAAAVTRGLGGGLAGRLAANPGETGAVTSEMREEARGAVLTRIIVAKEGTVGKVLDRVAPTLHSTDISFLLNALTTRGATNRAVEVLDWAEKAPKSMYRLRPQAAAYAAVARGFLREGNVTVGVDFALSSTARGKQLGMELWGRLLVGLAREGELRRVSEVLDWLQKHGEAIDGRYWRGLGSAHVKGDNRPELVGFVSSSRGVLKGSKKG